MFPGDSQKGGIIRPYHSTLVLLQRLADVCMIVLAHVVAVRLYDHANWVPAYTVAAVSAGLLFLFAAEAFGLYRGFRGVPLRHELARVWGAWAIVVAALLLTAFALKQTATYSRVANFLWFLGAPTLVSVVRTVARATLKEARRRGLNTRRVAIVGMTEMAERVAKRIRETPWLGLELDGVYEDRALDRCHEVRTSIAGLSGNFSQLVERAKAGELDGVYMCLPLKAEPRVNELLRQLADTTASVYYVPDFYAFDLLHGRWSQLGEIPLVSVFETPFQGTDGWLKRLEDIVLGTCALAVAAIPMLFIAIGVKVTSRGPVFFRQRRYGLNGEVIDVLKFRSMTVMENGDDVKQATKGDKRITPFGRFLRRTSLDELPQLFHVVSGSMSLVGPRPHAVAHNELYRKRIHGYMLRHKVKPGLTGWAQVNGWRGETDTLDKMEKRIEHDLDYIRRWNLLFDLRIVFMTFFSRSVHNNAR
ncbi:MAG: undecaprenyl-phosphate glucose phosphotransferase [Myxococcota bacterium]